MQREITDDLEALLDVLPTHICRPLRARADNHELLEIVMDLGRLPEARYPGREVVLSDIEVTEAEIDYVVSRIGEFGDDNRAGIERTLHRISAIRNRRGRIVGLTCRVGRAVYGTITIIDDLVQSGKSILLLGKPGVGKCVTGETLVLTAEGVQPLADLIPDGLEEDTFAPIRTTVHGMNGLEPASHAYNGGLAPTLRIATRQGYSLEGTREHPVLALTDTGDLVFRRLDELQPGDYLAIQRGQQVWGMETRLPVCEFAPRTNALDGRVPERLDEDLARFLGYLVAEGTLSFDNQVTFSHSDPETQADMAGLTEKLFGLRLRRHLHRGEWNGRDFRIFGVKLRRFLAHLGLAPGRAADKRIPPCILTAPKPVVSAFLRALFEGNGSVHGPDGRIEIASASRELLSCLHVVLLNYGIVGSLRVTHNTTYDRDYHSLTLLGSNVLRFAEQIGFLSTRKRARLAEVVARKTAAECSPNLDVVPHLNDRLRELYAQVGRGSATLARFARSDNRAPSYASLQRIMAETPAAADRAAHQTLSSLPTGRFFYDPVVRIEAGEAYVHDLSVPGSHSFFANGFVSHNTTMLRETARVLADDMNKRVIIVDTSNEIAGDGDIPHPAIGSARRMQVPTPADQHAIMIEAVENHMPEVIVIDEIGTELEAAAARTIAERGVQLVGTAHGNILENLMMNPTLADLIGGIQSVTLSDEEARRRGTQKSILERKAPPTFDVVVEIQSWERVAVHENVAETVDALLRGFDAPAETRELSPEGEVQRALAQHERPEPVRPGRRAAAGRGRGQAPAGAGGGARHVYPFGIARNRLEQAVRATGVVVVITDNLDDADAVITLRNYYRRKPGVLRDAEARQIPIYVLKNNTVAQMEQSLVAMREPAGGHDPVTEAMRETEDAIGQVMSGERAVDLAPANSYIRRLQHQIAQRYNVVSRSHGREPHRRVRIYQNADDDNTFGFDQ